MNTSDTLAGPTIMTKVGCEFLYDTPWSTPAVFVVRPISHGIARVLSETWSTNPSVPSHDYLDLYGNECRRLTLPAGPFSVTYDAIVECSLEIDAMDANAVQHDPADLPDDVLVYTLPSRFAQSDLLGDEAWRLFGGLPRGWELVQGIVDFVHGHLKFGYGASVSTTSAIDVYASGNGVCRDFAHLAVAFCRAMNVPARYAFGYLPDIGIEAPLLPMDFCAWFEVYLGDRWWTFDPRNNARRFGRSVIARGRDALDVAMVTSFGKANMYQMTVWADEAPTS